MWQAGPMLVTRIGEGLIAYGRATGGWRHVSLGSHGSGGGCEFGGILAG